MADTCTTGILADDKLVKERIEKYPLHSKMERRHVEFYVREMLTKEAAKRSEHPNLELLACQCVMLVQESVMHSQQHLFGWPVQTVYRQMVTQLQRNDGITIEDLVLAVEPFDLDGAAGVLLRHDGVAEVLWDPRRELDDLRKHYRVSNERGRSSSPHSSATSTALATSCPVTACWQCFRGHGHLHVDLRARALRAMPTWQMALTLMWVLVHHQARRDISFVMAACACYLIMLLLLLAALSTTPTKGTASPELIRCFRYMTALPVMDTFRVWQQLRLAPTRPDLALSMIVHAWNLVTLLYGIHEISNLRMTVWMGVRTYYLMSGLQTLANVILIHSIGGNAFPSFGGTGSAYESLTYSTTCLVIAATARPSVRQRVLETWTHVSLDATAFVGRVDRIRQLCANGFVIEELRTTSKKNR